MADLGLRWAHMPFGWFCHILAELTSWKLYNIVPLQHSASIEILKTVIQSEHMSNDVTEERYITDYPIITNSNWKPYLLNGTQDDFKIFHHFENKFYVYFPFWKQILWVVPILKTNSMSISHFENKFLSISKSILCMYSKALGSLC